MKYSVIILAFLTLTAQFFIPYAHANEPSTIRRKLKEIIIDRLDFEEVDILSIVKFIQKRSRELDPEKTGVNILLRLPRMPINESDDDDWDDDEIETLKLDSTKITLVVNEIPLGEAIEYICKAANLMYLVDEYAVKITSVDFPGDTEPMEIRIYPIGSEIVPENEILEKHFSRKGVTFPCGAKIYFDSRLSRLFITNTPTNLNVIDRILGETNNIDPQVLIELKTIRLLEGDYRKLKNKKPFSWKDILRSDRAEIIATSSILTLNGQEAVVRMITEKYSPESWGGGVKKDEKTGIVTKELPWSSFGDCTEIGQVLRVTPNVDADHYTISLDMNPVINAQTGWAKFGPAQIKTPKLKALSSETTITTCDGESILLGSKIKSMDYTPKSKNTVGSQTKSECRDFRIATFLTVRLMNPDGTPIQRINDRLWAKCKVDDICSESYFVIKNYNDKALPKKLKIALDKKVNVNFDKASISDFCFWLKKHLNIYMGSSINNELRFSMNLVDVPLEEVIRYACWLNRIDYEITPKRIKFGYRRYDEETRFYNVRENLIDSIINVPKNSRNRSIKQSEKAIDEALKSYFSDRGIPFLEDTSILYDWRTEKLIVKNIPVYLGYLECLLPYIDINTPLVKTEVNFVEISEKDLRKLLEIKVPVDIIPPSFFDRIINCEKSKIISGAEVIASSGSTAVFHEGENVYTPESYASPEFVLDKGKVMYSPPIPEFGDPRDLGIRFECTPTVSPNNHTINLNLHPQILKLTDWTKYSYDFKSKRCVYKMPEFGRCDAVANIKVYNGKTVMLARVQASTPSGDDKFPFFNDKLFSRQLSGEDIPKDKVTVKNLFIFVTARLVNFDGTPYIAKE